MFVLLVILVRNILSHILTSAGDEARQSIRIGQVCNSIPKNH